MIMKCLLMKYESNASRECYLSMYRGSIKSMLTDYVQIYYIYIILQIHVRCAMLLKCKANLALQSNQ